MSDFIEKTWWLWLIVGLLTFSFSIQRCSDANADIQDENGSGYNVVVVDNCEYIWHHEGYSGYMAHKGNCKYCRERNIQLIDSIVKANK